MRYKDFNTDVIRLRTSLSNLRHRAPEALTGWALSAVLATVAVWPILVYPGLPAFFHDWTWPLFRDRALWTWHLDISAWSPNGIGAPNSVPTLNPAAWLKIALAAIMPAIVAAKAYLWLSVFAATAGIYRLARVVRVEHGWSLLAATLFAVSPYVFAKIASGQSSEWSAIAAFTWGSAFAIQAFRTAEIRLAAGSALCFALASNQLQFLVFAELTVAIAFVVYRSPLAWKVWLTIAAGATVFALPSLFFLALRGPMIGADVSAPYGAWEYSQSSSMGDTFALLGYAAKYPETFLAGVSPAALDVVRWAMWATGALALAGAVLSRSRCVLVLFVIGVAGALWISGTRGPAADFWEWLFGATPLSAFLREFYHGAVLLAVPYAVLPAIALARAARRSAWPAMTWAALLAAGSGLATWLGGLGPTLPHVTPPAYADALRSTLPPRDGRVLFVPPERPLFVPGDRVGGVDAFDWAGTGELSLFSYYPPGPVAFAAAALRAHDADAAVRVLPRLGCDAIVWRSDVTSPLWPIREPNPPSTLRATALPGGAFVARLTAPALVSGARTVAPLPPSLDEMSRDTSIVYLDVPGTDAATLLPRGLTAPDPSRGWVGYRELYASFVNGLATPTLGIVTTKPGARIVTPHASRSMLLWAPNGAFVDGRRVTSQRYVRLPLPGDDAVIASGPTAIGELDEMPRSLPVEPSHAAAERASPWSYRGTVVLHGTGVVVLRQRYDPGWVLSTGGARVIEHDREDGAGNAWVLSGNGAIPFTLYYAPQTAAFWLLALSFAVATGLCVLALRRGPAQRPAGA